jgi:hypothetical protein
MRSASDILSQISRLILWENSIKVIEQAQKEAYNEAIDEVLTITKRTYDEDDGELYLSAERIKQLRK